MEEVLMHHTRSQIDSCCTDIATERLRFFGRIFGTGGAFGFHGRVIIAFVICTVVPFRIYEWWRTGWGGLVIADVNFTDPTDFHGNKFVLAINMLQVAHGGFITGAMSLLMYVVGHSMPKELEKLTLMQQGMEDDHPEVIKDTIEEFRPWMSRYVFTLGLAATIAHGILSGGAALRRTADSETTVLADIQSAIHDGPTRGRLALVVWQIFIGWLCVSIAACCVICVRYIGHLIKENLRRIIERVRQIDSEELELEDDDIDQIAWAVKANQMIFKEVHEMKTYGLLFAMMVVIPCVEFFYWTIVFAMLGAAGDRFSAALRGVTICAVSVLIISLSAFALVVWKYAKLTDLCDALINSVNELRIRSHPKLLKQSVQQRIDNLMRYMQNAECGGGMGFYILGLRMSKVLFKTIVISYASALSMIVPGAMHFFGPDS